MNLSARFNQAPSENRRYLLDYTAQLASGETITSITATISSPTDPTVPPTAFLIQGIAIAPGALQVAFFATGGLDLNTYNVQFLATTSLTQVLEDIVQFILKDKLDA